MTDKKTEALKLALEVLAVATYYSPDLQQKRSEVIDAGLKALAEQTAQQHIEHCLWARNGHTPCPHVQPAQQQEPVAEVRLIRTGGNAGLATQIVQIVEGYYPAGTKLYTSPQPSKPWVGLMRGVRVEGDTVVITVKSGNKHARKLCEALLREKNA